MATPVRLDGDSVSVAEIDADVHVRLRHHFAAVDGFDYRFAEAARLGAGTVILEPQPAEQFSALTDHTAAAWPECPPYGGQFGVVIPHLTVGDRLTVDEEDRLLDVLRERLGRAEPITGRARDVSLLVLAGVGWSTTARYPLREAGS